MFAAQMQVHLPRRITAYFLLFGLVATIWLGLGAVYIARFVSDGRSESTVLRKLGRASSRVALSYVQREERDFQRLVGEIRTEMGADHCAIVSPRGTYLAHSDQNFVGLAAREPSGVSDRWGDVEVLRYTSDSGVQVHEYRSPLAAGGKSIGTLTVAVSPADTWSYLRTGAQFAPLAFIGPAICLAIGAIVINRLVRPVADIERQLTLVAMSPSLESCQLDEVSCTGAAAAGWNRFVSERLTRPQSESLDQRIRKSLERGQQHRLYAVLNSIPDGIATTDADGRLTYSNHAMSAILGLQELANGAADDAPVDAAQKLAGQLTQHWGLADDDPLLLEDNRNRSVVTELTRNDDGRRRILRVARHPISIVDSAKHETHVWTIRDVTQQKLAEEMRDQFVDTATHELRTPLANIKAYAETLAIAEVIDIEQQKQFLNTINSEATRLARFVDDLLSVSSMELGSLSLNRQVTDLGRLLNEVLNKVRGQVEEKQLTLDVKLPEKLPEPDLDKDKIAAVLVNLLGNAVKYTPAGGRIMFRVNVTDQHIEASIEDTGVGIAEHELPKLFEKFFRSDDPRVREQTGTGLGLALAQEVVRLHGGRITVESEIDKGSKFSVILPLS